MPKILSSRLWALLALIVLILATGLWLMTRTASTPALQETPSHEPTQDSTTPAEQPRDSQSPSSPNASSEGGATGTPLVPGEAAPESAETRQSKHAPEGMHALVIGQIREQSGKPLGGAKVMIFGTRDKQKPSEFLDLQRDTYSLNDGSFEIEFDQSFRGWLVVDKDGYARVEDFLRLEESAIVRRAYRLSKSAKLLLGRVTDQSSGRPLKGVTISTSFIAPGVAGSPVHRTLTTDTQGEFRIERLPVGTTILLHASSSTHLYEFAKVRFSTAEETKRVDFSLKRGKAVAIRVTDESGNPLSGASAQPQHGPFSFTGDEGMTLLLVEPNAGTFPCRITAEGFLDQTVSVDASSQSPQEFALERAPLLRGMVVNQRLEPVADAGVQVLAGDDPKGRYSGGQTADDGTFEISLRQLPVRSIQVTHSQYLSQELNLSENPLAPQQEVRIVLEDGDAELSGRILSQEGSAPALFRVWLTRRQTPALDQGSISRVFSNSEGRFGFRGLPEGTYDLVARTDEAQPAQEGRMGGIVVERGQVLEGIVVELKADGGTMR